MSLFRSPVYNPPVNTKQKAGCTPGVTDEDRPILSTSDFFSSNALSENNLIFYFQICFVLSNRLEQKI